MKTRILSLLVVASFFISSALIAQPRKGQKQMWADSGKKEMMEKRDDQKKHVLQKFFTEEQNEQMKELRLETAKKIKPLRNELSELMAHQRTLTTAENADLKAINNNIDKMSDIKTDIAKIMAAQHQQVRSLLTDEQLIRFDNMKWKKGPGHPINRKSMNRSGRGA